MVTNPAVHQLNNIEVQGGDSDFALVNIAGSADDVLLEYDDSAGQWSFAGVVSGSDLADGSVTVEELAAALGTDSNNPVSGTTYFENLDSGSVNVGESGIKDGYTVIGEGTFNGDKGAPLSISLSQTYDQIEVFITALTNPSGGADLRMRLNNESSTNYTTVTRDGTETAGQDHIFLVSNVFDTAALSGIITIDGAPSDPSASIFRPTIESEASAPKSPSNIIDYAYYENDIGPVNSIQFFTNDGTDAQLYGAVLGKQV